MASSFSCSSTRASSTNGRSNLLPTRSNPHLFEINTWPWLSDQARRRGRAVTLGTVDEGEWSRLRDLGIDLVYLMGIWRRSALGREMARANPSLFADYDTARPGW